MDSGRTDQRLGFWLNAVHTKARYTLPVFTGRVHGPWTWLVDTGVKKMTPVSTDTGVQTVLVNDSVPISMWRGWLCTQPSVLFGLNICADYANVTGVEFQRLQRCDFSASLCRVRTGWVKKRRHYIWHHIFTMPEQICVVFSALLQLHFILFWTHLLILY